MGRMSNGSAIPTTIPVLSKMPPSHIRDNHELDSPEGSPPRPTDSQEVDRDSTRNYRRSVSDSPETKEDDGERLLTPLTGGLRFAPHCETIHIESHTMLTHSERDAYYYSGADMNSFVRNELTRRKLLGIKSTSALAPDGMAVTDLDEGAKK
mmetsp:Transcript_30921/g.69464  ORF Transcript_30921/g.69464 Transcript_30921/m.69464 type:complete len:152 (-) Transcript_30921:6-461(-)